MDSRFESTYEELKQALSQVTEKAEAQFWVYLWGIETRRLQVRINTEQRFWVYLWGIETEQRDTG